ncbi:hypothetical protein [Ralstonia flatus]|uniref:hypothetical protein n=1 Tax=Ralstonia flatus TaxID=3058601 RepID=UPI00292FC103|nr:hypothetical protein [Ralstonia sp. LMG 32965]
MVVLALVVLGHLMLLAWWRDRPAPIPHDAFPVLQGQLLSLEIPHAPTLQSERSRPAAAQLPPTHSVPRSTGPAQQRPSAASAGADAVEARTLDLGAPPMPSPHARSHAENNIARSTTRGTGHPFGPDVASSPRAARPIEESRAAAGRWQARVEAGGSAYCLTAQDPSLRRDPFEKALAVPSLCR